MYKKSRKKQGIIIITTVVVLLIVVAVIIYPTVNNIIKMNRQIVFERMNLELKLAAGLNITKTKAELTKIDQYADDIDSILIETGQEIEFVQLLENLAIQNGIHFDIQSDFIGVGSNKLYTKIPLNLIITGNYTNIVKYISDLESLPNYLNIEMLTAIKAPNATEGIRVQINGHTYIKLAKAGNDE
jgi:Tfp pilus assembly protein PilO